jgi:hypothetical protein
MGRVGRRGEERADADSVSPNKFKTLSAFAPRGSPIKRKFTRGLGVSCLVLSAFLLGFVPRPCNKAKVCEPRAVVDVVVVGSWRVLTCLVVFV